MIVGWLVYVAIYVGFAFAESQLALWVLFVVYGAHHGLSEAAEKALVADAVSGSRWGTAFGAYHLTVGALTFAASVIFGALWATCGAATAFLTSAALAGLAAGGLFVLGRTDEPCIGA